MSDSVRWTRCPRAEHVGDETWLATATANEMTYEMRLAAEERRGDDRVEDDCRGPHPGHVAV